MTESEQPKQPLQHEFLDPSGEIPQDLRNRIAESVNQAYDTSDVEFRDSTYHPYKFFGMCEKVSRNLRKILNETEELGKSDILFRGKWGPLETDSGNPEYDGHVFLKHPYKDGNILIDPTYLQFLDPAVRNAYPPALLAFYRSDEELQGILLQLPIIEPPYVYGYYLGFENPAFKEMLPEGYGREFKVVSNDIIDFMQQA